MDTGDTPRTAPQDAPGQPPAAEADGSIVLPPASPADEALGDDTADEPANLHRELTAVRPVQEGRFGRRYGLSSPRLPVTYKFIDHAVDEFRREMEAAVRAAGGTVDLAAASTISEACDHERARRYLLSRLRRCEMEGREVDLSLAVETMRAVTRCASLRNAAIARLGLSPATAAGEAGDSMADYLAALRDR